MSLPPAIDSFRKRPGMFLSKVEFDQVVAFLNGFNLASNGGLFFGFRQWLVVKLGHGNNLPWDSLVLRLTFPDSESSGYELRDPGDQKRAVESLFQLLEAFMQEQQSSEGLRRIFLRYEEWLKRQEWYVPSSPQWIADHSPATGEEKSGEGKRRSKGGYRKADSQR